MPFPLSRSRPDPFRRAGVGSWGPAQSAVPPRRSEISWREPLSEIRSLSPRADFWNFQHPSSISDRQTSLSRLHVPLLTCSDGLNYPLTSYTLTWSASTLHSFFCSIRDRQPGLATTSNSCHYDARVPDRQLAIRRPKSFAHHDLLSLLQKRSFFVGLRVVPNKLWCFVASNSLIFENLTPSTITIAATRRLARACDRPHLLCFSSLSPHLL